MALLTYRTEYEAVDWAPFDNMYLQNAHLYGVELELSQGTVCMTQDHFGEINVWSRGFVAKAQELGLSFFQTLPFKEPQIFDLDEYIDTMNALADQAMDDLNALQANPRYVKDKLRNCLLLGKQDSELTNGVISSLQNVVCMIPIRRYHRSKFSLRFLNSLKLFNKDETGVNGRQKSGYAKGLEYFCRYL